VVYLSAEEFARHDIREHACMHLSKERLTVAIRLYYPPIVFRADHLLESGRIVCW